MSGQSCEPGGGSLSWRAELEMGNGHDREALICDRAAASLKVKVQAKGHETGPDSSMSMALPVRTFS